MADLYKIEYETSRKEVLDMLERNEKMWPSHLGKIRGVSDSIQLKKGTQMIPLQPYHVGPQCRVPIEEKVNKRLTVEFIEAL